jgi:hypothetical protein
MIRDLLTTRRTNEPMDHVRGVIESWGTLCSRYYGPSLRILVEDQVVACKVMIVVGDSDPPDASTFIETLKLGRDEIREWGHPGVLTLIELVKARLAEALFRALDAATAPSGAKP